jgi:DNA-binding MarR family transcriptional regulator
MSATTTQPRGSLLSLSTLLYTDEDANALSYDQLAILGAVLAAAPTPIHITQAAEMTGVPHYEASRISRRLVQDGFLTRTNSTEGDLRYVLLSPTPKGRALDARIRGYIAQAFTTP